MMELDLCMLAVGLVGCGAVAFARRCRVAMVGCLALFVPVAAAATVAVWWPLSPTLALVLLAVLEGVPLVGVVLYGIDLAFAPFCLEMTYAALLCWLGWPLLVLVDFLGLLVRLLGAA